MTVRTQPPQAAPEPGVAGLRGYVDDLDTEIIRLFARRAEASRRLEALRLSAGGTCLALAWERQVAARYAAALGRDGQELGWLVLRAGRGRLPRRIVDRPLDRP